MNPLSCGSSPIKSCYCESRKNRRWFAAGLIPVSVLSYLWIGKFNKVLGCNEPSASLPLPIIKSFINKINQDIISLFLWQGGSTKGACLPVILAFNLVRNWLHNIAFNIINSVFSNLIKFESRIWENQPTRQPPFLIEVFQEIKFCCFLFILESFFKLFSFLFASFGQLVILFGSPKVSRNSSKKSY